MIEVTKVVRKTKKHPKILVAVDPDLELSPLEVWHHVVGEVQGLPEPSVNVTDLHLRYLAEYVLADEVSREGYYRVWRAVQRERLALITLENPVRPRLAPAVYVPPPAEVTISVQIPWERTCVAYKDHQSVHIVREGVAICPSCRDALVVVPELDVPHTL